jgi:hypothetical protein
MSLLKSGKGRNYSPVIRYSFPGTPISWCVEKCSVLLAVSYICYLKLQNFEHDVTFLGNFISPVGIRQVIKKGSVGFWKSSCNPTFLRTLGAWYAVPLICKIGHIFFTPESATNFTSTFSNNMWTRWMIDRYHSVIFNNLGGLYMY